MYNPGTKAYAGEGGAGSGYAPIDENHVYGASGVAYDAMVKAHGQTTPYYYFLGNDVVGSAGAGFIIGDASLQFTSGTAYGKALSTTKYHIGTIFNASSDNFTANSSYTFNIKVKSKDRLLLYQDGTVGYFGDKVTGVREPIAVVIKEKTGTEDGTAVALTEATVSGNNEFTYSTPYGSSSMFATTNSTTYADINDGQNDVNGYKWTWDAASNPHDHVVKADKYQDYTPYYAAGHYTPSVAVTGANVGRWYLPALGDWALLFKALDEWNPTPNATYPKEGTFPWNKAKVNAVFTAAGGKGLFDFGPSGYNVYWTSTEYSMTTLFPHLYLYYNGGNTINIMNNAKHNIAGKVRPFVHF